MIYYTSDLHLGNKNIIEYENRPWKTVEEMDAALIGNWNQVVGRNDEVYVLGDFCFKGATTVIHYLEKLNGYIHLIRGNHDHFMSQRTFDLYIAKQLNSRYHSGVCTPYIINDGWYKHILDGEHEVVLCHFPILHWEGREQGSLHLYGHVHSYRDTSMMYANSYHAGTDAHNYRPVTLQELLSGV